MRREGQAVDEVTSHTAGISPSDAGYARGMGVKGDTWEGGA